MCPILPHLAGAVRRFPHTLIQVPHGFISDPSFQTETKNPVRRIEVEGIARPPLQRSFLDPVSSSCLRSRSTYQPSPASAAPTPVRRLSSQPDSVKTKIQDVCNFVASSLKDIRKLLNARPQQSA